MQVIMLPIFLRVQYSTSSLRIRTDKRLKLLTYTLTLILIHTLKFTFILIHFCSLFPVQQTTSGIGHRVK